MDQKNGTYEQYEVPLIMAIQRNNEDAINTILNITHGANQHIIDDAIKLTRNGDVDSDICDKMCRLFLNLQKWFNDAKNGKIDARDERNSKVYEIC